MTFLDGRKGGDTCHDGDRDNGPEHHRDCYEEQKACQFVGLGVGKAETFVDDQCRYLIDNLDDDNQSRPDPQPGRNLKDRQQPYCATHYEADVRHAVQHGAGLALGMESPRQVPIDHITDAAQTIDYPESRTCRITEQQTGGPE